MIFHHRGCKWSPSTYHDISSALDSYLVTFVLSFLQFFVFKVELFFHGVCLCRRVQPCANRPDDTKQQHLHWVYYLQDIICNSLITTKSLRTHLWFPFPSEFIIKAIIRENIELFQNVQNNKKEFNQLIQIISLFKMQKIFFIKMV